MARRKPSRFLVRLFYLVAALAILFVLVASFRSGPAPSISIEPGMPGIGKRTPVKVRVDESKRGLAGYRVELVQGERVEILESRDHTPLDPWEFWGDRVPGEQLTGDDRRLYDLVVRRFLGAFHPAALWERVERVTEVEDERFRSRARVLKELGWRSVLPPASEEGNGSELVPLAPGAAEAEGVGVQNRAAELEAEQTKPPPRITEARLLSLMENAGKQIEDEDRAAVLHEKGIGTPATRADIIENLIAKGYAVRVDKALRPTVKGIRLIDTLNRIQIDRLTSPELTGDIEFHLLQVERGEREAGDFMQEISDYASAIVERAKTFEYDELNDEDDVLGSCPNPDCGKPVIEMAWFYRCKPEPDVEREDDCPVRFWKDTSGRYLDKETVRALLRDGKSGELDGFTARSGRTYRGTLELLPDENWKVKVRSLGYNEGEGVSDAVEYEVNPEPLGRCPFEEECQVVESATQFICERALKEGDEGRDDEAGKPAKAVAEVAKADAPEGCGFVLPRTVCKREITRDEAEVYLRNRRTDLLTEFTSRFGRPFSATLVLKENGRHGFEFQPRGGAAGTDGAARKKTSKKASAKKKTKKKSAKKATAKKAGSKKAAAATCRPIST